ncbi:MAG: phosphate ABC transporter permease subunit PstC, partial [Christensenellaceae bacterium]|nr:phosphate ABC transporter permease subunit PstC [Christensenellaceae bacterium]
MLKHKEVLMRWVFIIAACASIAAVALICLFLFASALPTIIKIGPLDLLLGQKWKPGNNIYGILPMILGSLYVTAGAIVAGVPLA